MQGPVAAHPSGKNKDAARVGHPVSFPVGGALPGGGLERNQSYCVLIRVVEGCNSLLVALT